MSPEAVEAAEQLDALFKRSTAYVAGIGFDITADLAQELVDAGVARISTRTTLSLKLDTIPIIRREDFTWDAVTRLGKLSGVPPAEPGE